MKKKIVPILCLVPLMVGTVGYFLAGEMLTDSMYAAFVLYFASQASDAYNGFVEFARWTAPLVTATAILCLLKDFWNRLCWRISLAFSSDSVAVYSDEDIRIAFEKGTKAIYPGDEFKEYAKSQIIMFSDDERSLQFYKDHRRQLEKKKVYIGLRSLELGLMREMRGVTLFEINASMARLLWKELALWKQGKEMLNVVIYGSNKLAQEILSTGLQLNLFSLKQKIRYHFISENPFFQMKHPNLPLMNGDEICYYGTDERDISNIIGHADVVIVAERVCTELLQAIIAMAYGKKVYYYSPEEGDAGEYVAFGELRPFGRNEKLFTDENVRRQKLIGAAIELNALYAQKYNTEKNWEALSGFLKSSNISSADFKEVLQEIKKSEEEMAELEHIRWCRFHFLNYWRQGVPEPANKDSERRIHQDLVAYAQLDSEEKKKDIETVRFLLS